MKSGNRRTSSHAFNAIDEPFRRRLPDCSSAGSYAPSGILASMPGNTWLACHTAFPIMRGNSNISCFYHALCRHKENSGMDTRKAACDQYYRNVTDHEAIPYTVRRFVIARRAASRQSSNGGEKEGGSLRCHAGFTSRFECLRRSQTGSGLPRACGPRNDSAVVLCAGTGEASVKPISPSSQR